MYRRALQLTRDPERAEDLVQDACVRCLQNTTYDPLREGACSEASWTYFIVTSAWWRWLKDAYTQKRGGNLVELRTQALRHADDDEEYELEIPVAPRQENQVYACEVVKRIDSLTKGQRTALLNDLNGKPVRSERTTLGTARKRMRALCQ